MRKHSVRNTCGGLAGLRYQMHASWTAAKREMCDIDESVLIEWWSFNPAAKLIGLADRGSIEPKKQADLVF